MILPELVPELCIKMPKSLLRPTACQASRNSVCSWPNPSDTVRLFLLERPYTTVILRFFAFSSMSDGISNFPFTLFVPITESPFFCLRGRPIGLFTFCSSCGPSFFGRPGRLFGGVVSSRDSKSPGDLWVSVPAIRLVGVPSPDLLGLILGDEEADFSDVACEGDFLDEEADLGVVETDLAGEEADLDRGDEEADLDGGDEEADLDGVEEADLDGEVVLDGDKAVLSKADLGGEQAGELADFNGEETDFICKVAYSVLWLLGF